MALKAKDKGIDHSGNELPPDVYASARQDGSIAGYRVRWREEDEDGVTRQPSKSFSARKAGSLDQALAAAVAFLDGAREAVRVDGAVAKPDAAATMPLETGFGEWVVGRAPDLSPDYADKAVRLWDKEIATRSFARVGLGRLNTDPAIIVRFQDSLVKDGLGTSKRREILKLLRAVLAWLRKRHPNVMTVDVAGFIELPKQGKKRLAYAADFTGIERIIEQVLRRPARDDLLPIRDAALIAAEGYAIATRPSEWLHSAAWENLFPSTIEMQRSSNRDPDQIKGLKTGAHVALLLANAQDRIALYRERLEDRFGPQPGHGLIFQVLGDDGPVWVTPEGGGEPVPLAWSKNAYNQWVRRVWIPAREIAADAPEAPDGLAKMTFYDLRHTAISMALHSTLVMGPHGMNLHPLSGWAGHDIQTLQRYYAHFIARYHGQEPIDLEAECRSAREAVEAAPFMADERVSPQRAAQERQRERKKTEKRKKERGSGNAERGGSGRSGRPRPRNGGGHSGRPCPPDLPGSGGIPAPPLPCGIEQA
jgi:integrase